MTREGQLRKWLDESREREREQAKRVAHLEAKVREAGKVKAELDRLRGEAEAEEERSDAERRAVVEAAIPDWLEKSSAPSGGFAGAPAEDYRLE